MKNAKRFVQIYTGNGRGKTSAAVGLAVRAAGNGLKVLFMQIMKNYPYSELSALKKLEEKIETRQVGNDDFVLEKRKPTRSEKQSVKDALRKVESEMQSGKYDLVIFDEICVAIYFGLVNETEVLEILKNKPANTELILTGRYCSERLVGAADLVTEMKEVKHYYTKGVLSRKGFDS